MNSTFHAIKECIDASSAQARAARYRRLMLGADNLERIAQASHSQEVLEACYRTANALREEAHALDVTDMRDIDREAAQAEREASW